MELLRFTSGLLEEGFTTHLIRKACSDGEWERVRRGAYARPELLDAHGRHLRLIAATLPGIGADSAISHASAAVIHGIPIPEGLLERVWATREGSGNGRRGPVLHLRRCRLEPDEVTVIGGVPVTSLARTAIDLARLLSYEWGVIACDASLAAGLDRDVLLAAARRCAGWPGARRAMSAALFAHPGADSPLESVSRVQLNRLGFPQPVVQFPIVAGGAILATSDFGWEDHHLVGECDGKVKYGELLRPGETPADAVMREKRREERIRGAGFWIVRWGWAEAWNPPVLRSIVAKGFALAPRWAAERAS